MANELKMVFGATTTVISLAATLDNAANTYSGMTGCTMTLLNNATALYPYAKAVLNIPDTFAAVPTAGGTVDLYMYEADVDGTTDERQDPAALDVIYRARFMGSFVIDNQDSITTKKINIDLHGVQKAYFVIVNNTGQQISYATSATTVKVTPFTYAPT